MSTFQKVTLGICLAMIAGGLAGAGCFWDKEIWRIIMGCVFLAGMSAIFLGVFLLGKLDPDAESLTEKDQSNCTIICIAVVICLVVQLIILLTLETSGDRLIPLLVMVTAMAVSHKIFPPRSRAAQPPILPAEKGPVNYGSGHRDMLTYTKGPPGSYTNQFPDPPIPYFPPR